MTVACYVTPLPDGWPRHEYIPCRSCIERGVSPAECNDCSGSGEETVEDWGPYVSGSFTEMTMFRTFVALDIAADEEAYENRSDFSLQDLQAALCKTLSAKGDADLRTVYDVLRRLDYRNDDRVRRCTRELLRWYLGLVDAGCDVSTARTYIA